MISTKIILLAILLAAAQAATTCFDSLSFTSSNGQLWANGQKFHLKGANWFGFETTDMVLHGLWARDYHDYIDFLASNGFNTLRVPFSLELVLNDATPSGVTTGGMNTDLVGLSSLRVMDKFVAAAAAKGLLIVFDMHSFVPGAFIQNNMWYDANHPESMVIDGWVRLLTRYKNQWNVIGADIKNEPFGCTWGTGSLDTDFNLAAQRIAEAIHTQVSDRFLILVEGVGGIAPACADSCFWGENLQGARDHPIRIAAQNKVVYSPHVYGPQVSTQAYFTAPNFPTNMPPIWDTHFGFVANHTGNAQVIGEWGGALEGPNSAWMNALVNFLIENGTTDTFFWALNPNSGDTGGLLASDWTTPETAKLDLLAKLTPAPTQFSLSEAQQYCIANK